MKYELEEWRDVVGYEGLYEVSSLGEVRSVDRAVQCLDRWGTLRTNHYKGKLLKSHLDDEGRPGISLSRDGKVRYFHVSRLVATAFIYNRRELPQVDHIDGDPANNRMHNLRWVDPASNMRNKHRTKAKSGRIGVDFRRHCVNKPWRAQGTDRAGRPTHIGYFASKDEAEAAYRKFRADNF